MHLPLGTISAAGFVSVVVTYDDNLRCLWQHLSASVSALSLVPNEGNTTQIRSTHKITGHTGPARPFSMHSP